MDGVVSGWSKPDLINFLRGTEKQNDYDNTDIRNCTADFLKTYLVGTTSL